MAKSLRGLFVMNIAPQCSRSDFSSRREDPSRAIRRYGLAIDHAKRFFGVLWQVNEDGTLTLPAESKLPRMGFCLDICERENLSSLHILARIAKIDDKKLVIQDGSIAHRVEVSVFGATTGNEVLRINREGSLYLVGVAEEHTARQLKEQEIASEFRT